MTVEFYPAPNINCDHCGEFEWFVFCQNDFADVIKQARAAGWAIGQEKGEWVHTCPDCQHGTVRNLLEDYEP